MKCQLVFTAILPVLLWSCDSDDESSIPAPKSATAQIMAVTLSPDSTYIQSSNVLGTASLEQVDNAIQVTMSMSGLIPNSRHAVHMHMGSCENPGHHWNQGTTDSFCEAMNGDQVWAKPKAGDIGNINTDADGNGILVVRSELWSLGTNDHRDIDGAVIIVHQNGEDFGLECFEQHTHVHKNAKIACGSIQLN